MSTGPGQPRSLVRLCIVYLFPVFHQKREGGTKLVTRAPTFQLSTFLELCQLARSLSSYSRLHLYPPTP